MKSFICIIVVLLASVTMFAQDNILSITRAEAHLDEDRLSDAINACNTALADFDDYRLYLIKGKALLASGKVNEAIEAFRMASYIAPGSGEYALACLYSGIGETEKALESLENHLKSEYKLPEKQLVLSPELKDLELSQGWKKLWSREWYTKLEKGIAEAQYYVSNNRIEELSDLIKYLEPQYHGSSGMEYIMALSAGLNGDSKSELIHFRKAVEATLPALDSWSGYVDALLYSGEHFEGIEASEKALSLFPEEKNFILKLAENQSLSGDRDEAFKTVTLFLDISPGNEDGLSLAGKIAMEKRSYSDALRYFSSGIELYPGNPENYINRGDVYRSTSTWEFAISDYSMALDLDPVNADVYYNKALVLLKTGKRDDACRSLRMALKYGNKKAASAINRNCIR